MNELPPIGFIGLGIMGFPMAQYLAQAGYQVRAYNRNLERTLEAEAFADAAQTPREASAQARIVITMLTNPEAVQAVMEGPDGFLTPTPQGRIWIQMSTLDIPSTQAFAERARERGWRFVDCPVTGSKKQVEAAELILLAGAELDLLNEVRPVLQTLGKTIVHAGAVGSGTALKLCMNLIVAQMTTALVEATHLAEATGVAPEKLFEALRNSPALNCGYFRIKEQALLRKDFSPAFSLANMLKDVHFMQQEAERRGLPLPVTDAVAQVMEQAVQEGHAAQDLAAIYLTGKVPA